MGRQNPGPFTQIFSHKYFHEITCFTVNKTYSQNYKKGNYNCFEQDFTIVHNCFYQLATGKILREGADYFRICSYLKL